MKIAHNITVSNEARDWLLRHYMDPDVDHPSQLRFIPIIAYYLSIRDGSGTKISGPGYSLVKGEPHRLTTEIVSRFESGRKFFAIQFGEKYDENALYMIEYFDSVWYVLKE